MDARLKIAPLFPTEATQKHIVDELGDPQDHGKGMGGMTLLAYQDKSIQFSFLDERLFMLSFYFRSSNEEAKWPPCLDALHNFHGRTRPCEVEVWLSQSGIPCRLISVDGGDVIEAPVGVQFCFESGHLTSIHIAS
ncbi:hypothetical protein GCM10023213_12630 [Prosthecobacter algae]|uniref:Uncharacterized protein n=1 Tax=Prosthecobacter algae TaxID=1144682 RepID=A0ABP9NYJ8_9BACT